MGIDVPVATCSRDLWTSLAWAKLSPQGLHQWSGSISRFPTSSFLILGGHGMITTHLPTSNLVGVPY